MAASGSSSASAPDSSGRWWDSSGSASHDRARRRPLFRRVPQRDPEADPAEAEERDRQLDEPFAHGLERAPDDHQGEGPETPSQAASRRATRPGSQHLLPPDAGVISLPVRPLRSSGRRGAPLVPEGRSDRRVRERCPNRPLALKRLADPPSAQLPGAGRPGGNPAAVGHRPLCGRPAGSRAGILPPIWRQPGRRCSRRARRLRAGPRGGHSARCHITRAFDTGIGGLGQAHNSFRWIRTEALRCLKRHLARRIWKLLQPTRRQRPAGRTA